MAVDGWSTTIFYLRHSLSLVWQEEERELTRERHMIIAMTDHEHGFRKVFPGMCWPFCSSTKKTRKYEEVTRLEDDLPSVKIRGHDEYFVFQGRKREIREALIWPAWCPELGVCVRIYSVTRRDSPRLHDSVTHLNLPNLRHAYATSVTLPAHQYKVQFVMLEHNISQPNLESSSYWKPQNFCQNLHSLSVHGFQQ